MQLLLSSSETVAVIADPFSVLPYTCDYRPPTVVAEDIVAAWLISLPQAAQ